MADITSSSIEVSENGVIDREAQTVTDAVVAAGQDTSRNVDNESESSGKAEIPQNMEELLVEGNKLMEDIQVKVKTAIDDAQKSGQAEEVLTVVRSYIGNSLLEESVQTALKRLEGRMLLLRDDKELAAKFEKDRGLFDAEIEQYGNDFLKKLSDFQSQSEGALELLRKDEDLSRLADEGEITMKELLEYEDTGELLALSRKLVSEYAASDHAKIRTQNASKKAQEAWQEHGDDIMVKVETLIATGTDKYKGMEMENEKKRAVEYKAKGEKIVATAEGHSQGQELIAKANAGATDEEARLQAEQKKKEMVDYGITTMKTFRESNRGKEMISAGLKYVKEIERDGGVAKLIERGESLMSNAEQRQELLDKLKDTAMDFLVEYLPTVHIGKIVGKREDYSIDYTLDNIDLSGLLIPKTNVSINLELQPGELKGTKFNLSASQIRVDLRKVSWLYQRTSFPRISGGGELDCKSENVDFKVVLEVEETEEGRPRIIMNDPTIKINDLILTIGGSSLASVYNMLVTMFSNAVRAKLEESLVEELIEKASALLVPINEIAGEYWPLIQSLANEFKEEKKLEELEDEGKDGSSSSADSGKEVAKPAPSPTESVEIDPEILATTIACSGCGKRVPFDDLDTHKC